MANRFSSPNQQFVNSAGIPYSGGQLFFYASGTSTPQNTYSDSLLVTPNANPVILDSAGRAGSVFLQNLAYKVVLQDSLNNTIWTEDPVSTPDFTAIAQFQSFAGNPNGHVAGTAGSSSVPASVIWDDVNNILYVCTTTGNAAAAVWTAVNAAAAQSNTPTPQGRLTLTSNTPVLAADVIAATSIIYTAYVGNLVPVYNGSVFSLQAFASDLVLTLSASNAINTLYDVFVFLNSGVLTLVSGPAWSASTPGSCSRGSGAGTTALARVNGIWTNSVQISGKNGASTFTIPANQATYLGTAYIDATAGQVTAHLAWGQNRKYGLWNAYNRVPIILQGGDSTASWTYNVATIRASNAAPASYTATEFNVGSGTSCNGLTVLSGLAEEECSVAFSQTINFGAGITNQTGIGLNSTTAFASNSRVAAIGGTANLEAYSSYLLVPSAGINVFVSLEVGVAGLPTLLGTSNNMVLSAVWRG